MQFESASAHPRHIDTYLALASHAEVDSRRPRRWTSPELPTLLALWPETTIEQYLGRAERPPEQQRNAQHPKTCLIC